VPALGSGQLERAGTGDIIDQKVRRAGQSAVPPALRRSL